MSDYCSWLEDEYAEEDIKSAINQALQERDIEIIKMIEEEYLSKAKWLYGETIAAQIINKIKSNSLTIK